ncbi:MAG: hypothetical protein NC124_16790 [Clostridium sp.]|nr:hypothetical protein [Clostridium sp.]
MPCHAAWDDDDDDWYDWYDWYDEDDDDDDDDDWPYGDDDDYDWPYGDDDDDDEWGWDDGNGHTIYGFDFDGDGNDDLFIATDEDGNGTSMSYFENGYQEFVQFGHDSSDDDDDVDWGGFNDDDQNDGDEDGRDYPEDEDEYSNVGAYDNNNADITVPKTAIHTPAAGEVLFKDNLPAQSLKQKAKMDCVPTAIANILKHMGSEQSAEEIRKIISEGYNKEHNVRVATDGVDPIYLEGLMAQISFERSCLADIVKDLDAGYPLLALIDTDAGLHMVEIVGYFDDSKKFDPDSFGDYSDDSNKKGSIITTFQCINPGTGQYEVHHKSAFQNHPTDIYKRM